MDATAAGLDGGGWYVRKLESTLSFSDTDAWLVEFWSVIAEAPLDELVLELNLDSVQRRPAGSAEIAAGTYGPVDVHGGDIAPDRWPISETGRQVLGIRLPVPLAPGDGHDFTLTLSVPRFRRLRRHIYLPTVRCQQLELRVHFGRQSVPEIVSKVSDAIDSEPEFGAARSATPVNRTNEVAVTFTDLVPGLAYGVTWSNA